MAWEKVQLGTQRLWFDFGRFEDEGGCALAYEHHVCDGVLVAWNGELSYAHAYQCDGSIMRFQEHIGDVADLTRGWDDPSTG
jgi:hypothetical protein